MIPAIKAEFRKLLTVRSTYVIVLLCMLITAFFAGFIVGFRNSNHDLASPGLFVDQSTSAIVFVGFLLAFVGLLLAGHEYRYTTIMYTLTASRRRLWVLLAKVFVVTIFSILVTVVILFFSPLCTVIGAHLGHHTIGPQHFNVWSVLWKGVFCGWGYSMYALILLFIMRNQIGAIVVFLLFPLIGENILMQLLKDNSMYMPFTALQGVAQPASLAGNASSGHEAVVVLVYLAVGLIASAAVFLKRDAN